jgi:hypothetical protein
LNWIWVVVEGITDEAVANRLLDIAGLNASTLIVTRGKGNLDKQLSGYNAAAKNIPWLVLRDLDRDGDCAPELLSKLLPHPSPKMHLRIPVRSVESWLLADRDALARALSVPCGLLPVDPERELDPKRVIVDIARKSSSSKIIKEIVPSDGSGAHVGPGYTARMIEFVKKDWDPKNAALLAPSLESCISSLSSIGRP